jgi:hypothetical protein
MHVYQHTYIHIYVHTYIHTHTHTHTHTLMYLQRDKYKQLKKQFNISIKRWEESGQNKVVLYLSI